MITPLTAGDTELLCSMLYEKLGIFEDITGLSKNDALIYLVRENVLTDVCALSYAYTRSETTTAFLLCVAMYGSPRRK